MRKKTRHYQALKIISQLLHWSQRRRQLPGLGKGRNIKTNLYAMNGEGNGSPLQYSCPENPMDSAAWQDTVLRVAKSWTRPD